MFERTLPNGQVCDRLWLLYSPSQGSVFCFMCKLFSKNRENPFVENGFNGKNLKKYHTMKTACIIEKQILHGYFEKTH